MKMGMRALMGNSRESKLGGSFPVTFRESMGILGILWESLEILTFILNMAFPNIVGG